MNHLLKSAFITAALGLANLASAHVPHDIIYSLDVSPTYGKDGTIFASSTQFGEAHLVSKNQGETFSESHKGMDRDLITDHAFSPDYANDGTVFMVGNKGYYKSTDRGENWVKQPHFANQPVLDVLPSPAYAKIKSLFILTQNGVHVLRNDGQDLKSLKETEEITFGKLGFSNNTLFVHSVYYEHQEKKKGMEHIDYASGTLSAYNLKDRQWFSVSPSFDQAIVSDFDIRKMGDDFSMVVALKNGGIHLSEDSSKSWKKVFQKKSDFIAKLAFSPNYSSDETIALGTAKGFIYLSHDKGLSWKAKSNGLSRWVHHTDILVTKLQFSPNYENDRTLFLGKTTGFYKSTDNGDFWRHVNVWNTKWGYYVYPAPGKDSKDLFTATYNSGISRSENHGESWQSANVGITAAFANGMRLSPDFANDKNLFVVDIATGLYRSRDKGVSWNKIEELDISKQYDQPVLFRELGVSNDFKRDGLMFLFTVPRRVLGLPEKHVWKYNDKTKSVTRVMIGNENNYINAFAFPPIGSKQNLMFCASAQGVFTSRDKGDTWQNAFQQRGIEQIFISPNFDQDGRIFLMSNDGEIYQSNDSGKTFEKTELGLGGQYLNNLTYSPNYKNDNTLYATTFGQGVLRSTDNGKSWSYFGLKGKFLYTGLSFSGNYAKDGTIFAPTIDGIFRSTDKGKSWSNVLKETQFLPKVPFLTLKDPQGNEITLKAGTSALMKQYDAYDEEIAPTVLRPLANRVETIKSSKAYLGSYYKMDIEADYAIEVYFHGTSIDFKCVQANDLGIVRFELDGNAAGEFDLYSAKDQFDVTGFSKSKLKDSFHTLRIIATGKKHPKSSGTALTFNAANIKN